MKKTCLIIGATSKIAEETARIWAMHQNHFILVARSLNKLEPIKNDLLARGASSVEIFELEFTKYLEHDLFINNLFSRYQIDLALLAHGLLGSQADLNQSTEESLEVFDVNLLSYVSLLIPIANQFESKGKGQIVVLSSVAGDRGRKSMYTYGAAKAAVSHYCEGLANRLRPKGVAVTIVKPGPVDTPMTAHLKQGFLFVKPTLIANDIVRGLKKPIVYSPWYWCYIMTIIKWIPSRIYRMIGI